MPLYSNQTLKIYNSLSGEKTFVPIHEGNVGMYVCGPTVYSNASWKRSLPSCHLTLFLGIFAFGL
jgi:hypothetical protein